jgi:hypothetical protein
MTALPLTEMALMPAMNVLVWAVPTRIVLLSAATPTLRGGLFSIGPTPSRATASP